MKLLMRLFVSGIATLGTYCVVFLAFFSLVLPSGDFEWIRFVGSLGCAMVAARFTWRQTAAVSQGLVNCVVLGAFVTGGVGFSAGFFGPIIFDPGANQGPLLGIFITGPLGFLAGGVGGAIYWLVRGKGTTETPPVGTSRG
jgi:hypothetical protein